MPAKAPKAEAVKVLKAGGRIGGRRNKRDAGVRSVRSVRRRRDSCLSKNMSEVPGTEEGRSAMKTFKEKYQAGEIEFEAIDDYSYEWGMGDDERTLAQYLGLNAEEEDAWVSIGEDALREMLDSGMSR